MNLPLKKLELDIADSYDNTDDEIGRDHHSYRKTLDQNGNESEILIHSSLASASNIGHPNVFFGI